MDDYDLAIDNGLAGYVEGTGKDEELIDPVVAVTGEGFAVVTVDVELNAVAVVLDLVNPVPARGGLHLEGGELGLNEARHRRFDTPWHYATHKQPEDQPWTVYLPYSTSLLISKFTLRSKYNRDRVSRLYFPESTRTAGERSADAVRLV